MLRAKKKITSFILSLTATVVLLLAFNWEPHENHMMSDKIFKNMMLGTILIVCIYPRLIIEDILNSYKIKLEEQDRIIERLKKRVKSNCWEESE